MRILVPGVLLGALLAACSVDPNSTQSASDTTSATAETSSGTTITGSTGEPTTVTTSEPTTDATTDATTDPATDPATDPTRTSTDTTDPGMTGTTSDTDTASTDSTGVDTDTTGAVDELKDAMDALEAAVAGVTYPSESDYPWVVVGFAEAAPVNVGNVKQMIAGVYVPHEGEAALADRTVELRTLAQLLDPLTTPQDWWEDYNFMVAAQYDQIRSVLESKLVDIKVFRIGEKQGNVLQGAVDIYVLGATPDGDVVGMWTVSVET